jgi:hypothetical protein
MMLHVVTIFNDEGCCYRCLTLPAFVIGLGSFLRAFWLSAAQTEKIVLAMMGSCPQMQKATILPTLFLEACF